MQPPRSSVDNDDYQLECEEAIDDAIRALADRAVAAGWDEDVVMDAILSVVRNRKAGRIAH